MSSTIKPGDRVRHQNARESFGTGVVETVNPRAKTALVRWDDHEVERTTSRLDRKQSHVDLKCLTLL